MSGSDSNVEVKVTADVSQLKSQLAEAQANVKAFSTSVDNLTQAAKTYGSQASIEAQLKKDSAALDEARAKVAQLSDELKSIEAPATQAAEAMDKIAPAADRAHGSTMQIREAIVLLHEAVTGRLNRIPGSLLVMAEYSGALKSAIAAITPEVAVLGVAVAAVGVGLAEWAIQAYQAEQAIRAAALAAAIGGRPGARKDIETEAPGVRDSSFGTVSTNDAIKLTAAIVQLNEVTDEQKKLLLAAAPAFLAMYHGNIAETEKFIAETFKSEASVKAWIDHVHLLGPAGIAAWDSTTDATKRFEIAIEAINARIIPMFTEWAKGAKAFREELALSTAAEGGSLFSFRDLRGGGGGGASGARGNIPSDASALIENTAKLLGLDQTLTNFATQIAQSESGGSQTYQSGPKAGQLQTSPTRALGMMQVEPDDRERGTTKTIAGQTLDLTDTAQNVKASLLMLSESYKKHNGDLREVAADYVGRGTSPAAVAERTKYLGNLDQRGAFGGAAPSFKPFGDQSPGTTTDLSADRDRVKVEENRKANLELEHLEEDRKIIFDRQTKDTADAARAAAASDTDAFNAARKRMEDDVEALRENAAKKALVRTAFDKETEKSTARGVETTKSDIADANPDRRSRAIESARAEEEAWKKAAETVGLTEGAKADFEEKAYRAHIALRRAETAEDGTFMSQKMALLRAGEADEAESALKSGATHEQMRARELQFEKNYWEQVKAAGSLTTEQQRQVEEKLSEVRKRIAEEAVTANKQAQDKQFAATEARLSHEVQLARGNLAQIIAIEDQKVAAAAGHGGGDSAEYFRALEQRTSAEKQAVDQQARDAEQAAQRNIQAEKARLESELALGQTTKTKMLQQLEQYEASQYSMALQTLQKIIDLNGLDVAAHAEAIDKKTKLEEKFNTDLAKLRAQEQQAASASAMQTARAYEQAFSQIGGAAHSATEGLITGQTTWLQAEQSIARSVLSSFLNLTEMMLGRWITTQLAMATSSKATQVAVENAQEASAGTGFPVLLARWIGLEAAKTQATTVGAATRATADSGAKVQAELAQIVAKWTATEATKTATTTAGAATRSVADTSGGFFSGIARMLAGWLGLETAKTAATTVQSGLRSTTEATTAIAASVAVGLNTRLQIAAAAAEAAAWAFADSASLGPVGLAAAPAAALSAEAAVMSFQTLVPLATGVYDVKTTTPALLHQGEMVIPQSFASSLRSAVGSGGSSTTNNSGTSNNTFNYNPKVAAGGGDVGSQLRAHGAELKSWVMNSSRNGNLMPPRGS